MRRARLLSGYRLNAPEQAVDRSQFLGGSDAAAVLGLSPWSTPLEVYLWKIGEPTPEMVKDREDPKRQKLFRRGKREEPHIVDDLAEDYGIQIVRRSFPHAPNRYKDQEHPFLAAEIDFEWMVTPQVAGLVSEEYPAIAAAVRELVGTVQNGEVKTVHHFAAAKFGQAATEEVPIEYAAQAMHGLMVTGRKLCMFAVRVGAGDVQVYWIMRNDQTIAQMRPRLVSFWNDRVLAKIAPEPMRYSDVAALLFRRAQPVRVEASVDAIKWLGELEAARDAEKVAKEAAEEAKFQIGKFMLGDESIVRPVGPRGGKKSVEPTDLTKPNPHELLIDGQPALCLNLQEQSRIDSDRLRKERPEIAAEFSKDIRFFRFDPPRKKR